MYSLPKYLYRGDSDPYNQRMLKTTFKSQLLMTNLCSGGKGREIFNEPLGHLIDEHIGVGWNKTHFLSFSTEKQRAFYYGSNIRKYYEVYDENETWDFVILTFDTTFLIRDSIMEIGVGIYSAQFIPDCKEFSPTYKVILIDAFSYLKNIVSKSSFELDRAIANADKDKEWLILPASPFDNDKKEEFTSKFDAHCITEKRVYRYE